MHLLLLVVHLHVLVHSETFWSTKPPERAPPYQFDQVAWVAYWMDAAYWMVFVLTAHLQLTQLRIARSSCYSIAELSALNVTCLWTSTSKPCISMMNLATIAHLSPSEHLPGFFTEGKRSSIASTRKTTRNHITICGEKQMPLEVFPTPDTWWRNSSKKEKRKKKERKKKKGLEIAPLLRIPLSLTCFQPILPAFFPSLFPSLLSTTKKWGHSAPVEGGRG